jgi:LPS-assembly protein
VARASYQPSAALTFTSRFRFSETDFTLQRSELEAVAAFGRWTTTVMYGNYAPQPLIGFLNRREGILGSARLKLNPNWVLLGAAGYDVHAKSVTQTQIGVGYIDDCLILALNYVTSYAYSGSVSVNHSYMMQISLRTLGGTTNSAAQGVSPINTAAFGTTH